MKKNILRVIAMFVCAFYMFGFAACNDSATNKRGPYAGEYRFAGFIILKSSQEDEAFEPYDGDEDDAFAELTQEFSKQYVLEEANKQYFELNADGTAVWHLASYLNYDAAPVSVMRGTWDVEASDVGVNISYNFRYGDVWSSGRTEGEAIEKTLFLYGNYHHEVKNLFCGATEDGYSTENYWQIQAVYKKIANGED